MADRDLTEGSVAKAVFVQSFPMSVGILAVLSVGLVDAYFLGRLGGAPLAAVGYIYPVTAAITSLSIGLSAGANSALSQGIGRGDGDDATHRRAVHAIGLGLVASLVVALAFLAAYPLLFPALGAEADTMGEIGAFIPWWCLSFPFLVVMMVTNAGFRAGGDSFTASWVMVASAILNVALTPLLIFGWGPVEGFGTAGAAQATAIARIFGAALAVGIAWRREMLALTGKLFSGLGRSTREILSVGAPAAFSNAINPAGMALVTAAVATVAEAAVAGFGAATRIQALAQVPMLALSAGIGPVVGQNWGADKPDRAARAMRAASLFCLGYGVVLGLGLWAFARPLAAAIATGEEETAYAARYLAVVGWSLFGYGILVVANAAMNARGKALWSMSLGIGRTFVIYLPFAWAGVTLAGYDGVLLATVAANVLAACAALYALSRTGLSPFKLAKTSPATA